MSKSPEAPSTAPAPERGTADVDEVVRIPLHLNTEHVAPASEETQTEVPSAIAKLLAIKEKYANTTPDATVITRDELTRRTAEINGLPATAGSFMTVYDAVPSHGNAYESKDDFKSLLPEEGVDPSTPLNDHQKVVQEYLKNEFWTASQAQLVDIEALDRPTPAFPENARVGKIEYFIEDMEKARADTDVTGKQRNDLLINGLKDYLKILKEDKNPSEGLLKEYADLAGSADADPAKLEELKKALLENQTHRNAIIGIGLKIVANYFPADKSKGGPVSRSNKYAFSEDYDKYGPAETSVAPVTAKSAEPAATISRQTTKESAKTSSEETIAEAQEQLAIGRGRLAKSYRLRMKSRIRNNDQIISPHVKKLKKDYDTASRNLFELENSGRTNPAERLQAMFDYHYDQAVELASRITDDDIKEKSRKRVKSGPLDFIDPELFKEIAKVVIEAKKDDPELTPEFEARLWDTMQTKVHQSVEELIKEIHTGRIKRVGKQAIRHLHLEKINGGAAGVASILPRGADAMWRGAGAARHPIQSSRGALESIRGVRDSAGNVLKSDRTAKLRGGFSRAATWAAGRYDARPVDVPAISKVKKEEQKPSEATK